MKINKYLIILLIIVNFGYLLTALLWYTKLIDFVWLYSLSAILGFFLFFLLTIITHQTKRKVALQVFCLIFTLIFLAMFVQSLI